MAAVSFSIFYTLRLFIVNTGQWPSHGIDWLANQWSASTTAPRLCTRPAMCIQWGEALEKAWQGGQSYFSKWLHAVLRMPFGLIIKRVPTEVLPFGDMNTTFVHQSIRLSTLLLPGSGTYWRFTLMGHQNLYAFKNLCWIIHFSNFHSLENGRLFSRNFLRSSKSIATLSYTFYSQCLTLGCRTKPSHTGWKLKCITCNFIV